MSSPHLLSSRPKSIGTSNTKVYERTGQLPCPELRDGFTLYPGARLQTWASSMPSLLAPSCPCMIRGQVFLILYLTSIVILGHTSALAISSLLALGLSAASHHTVPPIRN